ncbi:MAG: chitobiase/beta-hexosaminidase C-terminal domain-containing protein, partial [Bacteroidales bacterium]|nr:chitobiase/beta-hexosaminidase C-terminal domain-containing protein [Bacteroidales bacterium]
MIVTSNTEASGTQLSVTVKNIAKGVKCYNISYTYEDESGKTPTQLSWSAPTATVDLASEVKEFPTLTKNPESITGITYSSSNADVATVNEASGEITLVACGQTTIKAAYAGDDTYASSSATYTLRVVDNSIAAGEYTIPLNNWFWATNHNGSFNVEKEKLKLQGQQNGISISLGNVNSTNAYVDDNETRTYSSYIMTVNAPEGYVLKKIVFVGTTWQSSTLNASAGNMGAQKIWSGNVSSVEFYFAGTCEIKNVKIAYEKAAPAKTLTSIAITGEPTKVAYETGESFNPEGLTVTATYDDKSTADVTADATWTFDPAVFNTTGSVTVIALAAYGGKDGVAEYTVTVSAKPLKLTITPATGTYTSAQTVTIEANNAVGNVAIYYTTDGSNPEEGANEYTAPFEVATTTTVKAYAIDNELRKATAESVITIKASTFAAENFSGCITQGGRDNNFSEGSGTLSDDNFDCGGWVYDATVYAANSCVRVGTKSNNG